MDKEEKWRESDIFVIRVFRSEGGDLTGVVQHVRTGEKVAFHELDSVGQTIAQMARDRQRPSR